MNCVRVLDVPEQLPKSSSRHTPPIDRNPFALGDAPINGGNLNVSVSSAEPLTNVRPLDRRQSALQSRLAPKQHASF